MDNFFMGIKDEERMKKKMDTRERQPISDGQTVRCKFVCNSVEKQYFGSDKFQWRYKFNAVYSNSPENKKYWDATPTGSLEFACMTLGPLFVAGKEYYLDLNLVTPVTVDV